MKCCHCPSNIFRMVDGSGLCFSCYTALQNTSNGNISSAYQAQRGTDVAHSMFLRAVAQQSERRINNERNAEVNNYNITVQGNNSGLLQAGKTLTQNNSINNLSKSGNGSVGWLAKIIANGLKKFWMWLIGFFG